MSLILLWSLEFHIITLYDNLSEKTKIYSAIKRMMKEAWDCLLKSPSYTPLLPPPSPSLSFLSLSLFFSMPPQTVCRSKVTLAECRMFSPAFRPHIYTTACRNDSLLDRLGSYYPASFYIRVRRCIAVIKNALNPWMIMGGLRKGRSVRIWQIDKKHPDRRAEGFAHKDLMFFAKITCVWILIKLIFFHAWKPFSCCRRTVNALLPIISLCLFCAHILGGNDLYNGIQSISSILVLTCRSA